MKKSIIYLGIAVITFTNVISALNSQQSFNNEGLGWTKTTQSNKNKAVTASDNDSIEKELGNGDVDSATATPEVTDFRPYQKTTEEIIAENNQIIESTIYSEIIPLETITENYQIKDISISIPVYNEKSIDEIMLQDSQIIENAILNEVQFIDTVKSKKV